MTKIVTNYKGIRFLVLLHAILLVSILILPVSAGSQNSVVISDYKVSPAVLMPGEEGTLTVTLKSISTTTATSSISYGSDVAQTTTSFTPYIDSVIIKSKDFDVLDGDSKFEGNIGPD